ncbi:hypothetical protein PIB30_063037 [Stylosanthes scabra]|uniref:CTLH domain-containing protein n=1 Tax=Stylosanthes scabra TaxID=79078 RepID=A0ABU6UK47_9FABA|nr:hypothetical protein [Stylosanthes scabra]
MRWEEEEGSAAAVTPSGYRFSAAIPLSLLMVELSPMETPWWSSTDYEEGKGRPYAVANRKFLHASMLAADDALFYVCLHDSEETQKDSSDFHATSKKVITREEWEKKLNDVKIRKEYMNKLIMNFLVTEGYVEATEKFQMESGTEHIDLATISDRMAVKKAVQSGNVEDAIEKVNDLNPEIRNEKVEEALEFAQEELAPRGGGGKLVDCLHGWFPINVDRRAQGFAPLLRYAGTSQITDSWHASYLLSLVVSSSASFGSKC